MASAWSADCHASGAVNFIATAVKGGMTLTFCGHDLARHLDALVEQCWEIVPLPRQATSPGVGTESTPEHFSITREQ